MKKVIVIFISLIFIVTCVGPEEPLDGLYKNTPVVVITDNAFTFSLQAGSYSTEENYNLIFPISTPINLTTVLIVTDFASSSNDSSYFDIFNSGNTLLTRYDIRSNINVSPVDSLDINEIPQKIYFKADNFSGFVQLVLAIEK